MFRHQKAPLCKNFSKCRWTKCQYRHTVDEEDPKVAASDVDIDNIISDEPVVEVETNKSYITKPIRCDYDFCDFENVMLATKNLFIIHLKNVHGIDRQNN